MEEARKCRTGRGVTIRAMSFREAARKLLQVIEDIHAEGREIIGERWTLYARMKGLADEGDLVGMVAYFEACKASAKGRRVREKLEASGKQSLETEERRFLEIAVPPICQMVIDGRQEWLASAYAGHRKFLENVFEQHRDTVARALKQRVVRDTQAMATRASKLPLMILRNPPLPDVRTCLADAAQCYLYGQFRAAVLLSRAALEAALRGRLPPMDQPDRLAQVIAECRRRIDRIYSDLESTDTYIKGIALELLALRIVIHLGLHPKGFRLRSQQTGGSEVDLVAEGVHLHFSRWILQCKNTADVHLSALDKEIGMAVRTKAHVIVLVTTGRFARGVEVAADDLARDSHLQVILVGKDTLQIYRKQGMRHLLEFFQDRASTTMKLKIEQLRTPSG